MEICHPLDSGAHKSPGTQGPPYNRILLTPAQLFLDFKKLVSIKRQVFIALVISTVFFRFLILFCVFVVCFVQCIVVVLFKLFPKLRFLSQLA